ncbi:MAG: hypothetical protein AAFY81_00340, partial [Pseudomonadota bacterium]
TPILEYSDAKTALVIDTMDLLFDRDIDAFVVVSSSASLARLAMRRHTALIDPRCADIDAAG